MQDISTFRMLRYYAQQIPVCARIIWNNIRFKNKYAPYWRPYFGWCGWYSKNKERVAQDYGDCVTTAVVGNASFAPNLDFLPCLYGRTAEDIFARVRADILRNNILDLLPAGAHLFNITNNEEYLDSSIKKKSIKLEFFVCLVEEDLKIYDFDSCKTAKDRKLRSAHEHLTIFQQKFPSLQYDIVIDYQVRGKHYLEASQLHKTAFWRRDGSVMENPARYIIVPEQIKS